MKKLILFAVFCSSFSLFATAGNGAETGTLHGTIVDAETKKPMANLTFSASIGKSSYQKEFVTDANGQFRINLPVGEHTIIIDHPEYRASKKEKLLIREGIITRQIFETSLSEVPFHPMLSPITIHSN